MGTDQIAEIRPLIRELFAGSHENRDFCLTFKVTDSQVWIQVTADTLNLYWPFTEVVARNLERELNQHFPSCQLCDIQEAAYATYSIELADVTETSHAIDWIFEHVYHANCDYSVDAEMISL